MRFAPAHGIPAEPAADDIAGGMLRDRRDGSRYLRAGNQGGRCVNQEDSVGLGVLLQT